MGMAWHGIAFVPPLLPLPYDEIDHLPGLMMMDVVGRGVVVMVMYDSVRWIRTRMERNDATCCSIL